MPTEILQKSTKLLSDVDAVKYAGQYVCTAGFDSKDVVSADYDASTAVALAKSLGFADPVVFYVPRPGEMFIL